MTITCVNCDGSNVMQDANILLDPAQDLLVSLTEKNLKTLIWLDTYFCRDCNAVVKIEEQSNG